LKLQADGPATGSQARFEDPGFFRLSAEMKYPADLMSDIIKFGIDSTAFVTVHVGFAVVGDLKRKAVLKMVSHKVQPTIWKIADKMIL
jgi:hypothetical protein